MSETSEAGAPVRILIVDDVADSREVLARRFERRGFDIVQAEGGAQALEIVAEGGLDLVLLDVLMPDVNGLDVLRRIRETHSRVELPVIMVTGQAESRQIVEALESGANDYITKPVDFAVALARVDVQVARRRAELELMQAHEVLHRRLAELHASEAASRAKGEFLATLSHEIRTPLNGVMGVAQVLSGEDLSERQRSMVGLILTSGAMMERLLNDVLDIARVEAGRLDVRPEPTDVETLVATVAGVAEAGARGKGLVFEATVAPDARGVMDMDPTRVSQILGNLLGNAVKFTTSGRVTLEVTRSGSGRRFVVRDTGIGFGPEVKARLFGRFEQGDGAITQKFGGSGLGLAISRHLAELMGATLDADAVPGEGATFTLELPEAEARCQAA